MPGDKAEGIIQLFHNRDISPQTGDKSLLKYIYLWTGSRCLAQTSQGYFNKSLMQEKDGALSMFVLYPGSIF